MGIILGNINEIAFFWYGLILSITILVAIFFILKNKTNEIDIENIIDISIYGIVTGLIVGRLLFVMNNLVIYKKNMWEILYLWQGGLSIYGIAIGVLSTVVIYCKIKKIELHKFLDTLSPGMIILLVGEQIANFISQDVIGNPAESRLSVYVEYAFRPLGFEQYDFFYPVSIYQAMWLSMVLIITLYMKNRIKNNCFDGFVFYTSTLLAAAGRFVFGFYYLGGDKGLQIEQIMSVIIILVIMSLFLYRFKYIKKNKEWK